jgi:hypothetical protein
VCANGEKAESREQAAESRVSSFPRKRESIARFMEVYICVNSS